MINKFLFFLLATFFIVDISLAKNIVDCRAIIGGTKECNPYGKKLLRATEINYARDKKKLIISKTMPVPEKFKFKIISVEDLIERYIKVEDSLRFKLSPLKLPLEINTTKNITIQDKNVEKIEIKEKKKVKKIFVRYGKYKVSNGDRFKTISKKFSMTTKELLRINLMDAKSKLKVGQKLRIPFEQNIIDAIVGGEYIIESGDSLHSIAKKFKLDSNSLERLNNISSHTLIKVGKKLKLPFVETKKKVKVTKEKCTKVSKKKTKRKKNKRIKVLRAFGKRKLRVTATAYSSHKNQTDDTPFLAAWNNRLRPGMKIIAVSRDMLTRYGMKNGTKVRIGGLPGYYKVRDKMNKRYRKRIDIYMGVNRRRALRWGRRSVVIHW